MVNLRDMLPITRTEATRVRAISSTPSAEVSLR